MERENNRFQVHAMRLRRRSPTRTALRAPGEAGNPAPLRRGLCLPGSGCPHRPHLGEPLPVGNPRVRGPAASLRTTTPSRPWCGDVAMTPSAGVRERGSVPLGEAAARVCAEPRVCQVPVRRKTALWPPEECPPPSRARFWGCWRRVQGEAAPPARRAAVTVTARRGGPKGRAQPDPLGTERRGLERRYPRGSTGFLALSAVALHRRAAREGPGQKPRR